MTTSDITIEMIISWFCMLVMGFCMLVMGFCIGWWIGVDTGIAHWKAIAIAEGKAEYYLDANGKRQWRWKP